MGLQEGNCMDGKHPMQLWAAADTATARWQLQPSRGLQNQHRHHKGGLSKACLRRLCIIRSWKKVEKD